jgi:4-amino-4-deoxy-L-arabinose transferase-like glycosyltransferase
MAEVQHNDSVSQPLPARLLGILKHPLTWIIVAGFCLRLYGVIRFPVIHDELLGILDGVNKTRISPIHFFFRASIKHTVGITPLYFWIERLFTDILGQNGWGLRFFPLLSGVLSPLLAYYVVRERFGKSLALLSTAIIAFSDIFVWVTSKSQYFEAPIIPLTFAVFYFATSSNKNRYFYLSLLFTLVLFTNYGRGLYLLLCFLSWYMLVKWFELTRRGARLGDWVRSGIKELAQLSVFLFLFVVWIAGAQWLAFDHPIDSVVGGGRLNSIWDALYRFGFGYGSATHSFVAGSPRGTFLVYNDTNVWPVTTILFVPFVLGMILLARDVVRHWRNADDKLFIRDSYLVALTALSLAILFSKGIIGERFHLFYFLPFAVACSMALLRLVDWFKDDKKKWLFVAFIFLQSVYVAYSAAWEHWYFEVWDEKLFYRNLIFVLLVTLAYGTNAFLQSSAREQIARYFAGLFIVVLVIALVVKGPLVWGTVFAWPPAYDNRLNDLEGNEETLIQFAIERNRPDICTKFTQEYRERCSHWVEKLNRGY